MKTTSNFAVLMETGTRPFYLPTNKNTKISFPMLSRPPRRKNFKLSKNIDWISRHEENFKVLKTIQSKRIFVQSLSSEFVEPNDVEIFTCRNYPKINPNENGNTQTKLCKGNFQTALAPVLAIAQCFGILPTKGITQGDAILLSFSWYNYRTIYAMILLFFYIFSFICTIIWVSTKEVSFDNIEPLVFQVSVAIISYNFLVLASKWPGIMLSWQRTEKHFPKDPNFVENGKSNIVMKVRSVALVGLVLSSIEHILSLATTAQFVRACASDNFTELFFKSRLREVWYSVGYLKYGAVPAMFLVIAQTFVWNFMDFFVMMMSVGLTERFKQINKHIFAVKGQNVPPSFWNTYRKHYRSLCNLCDDVDTEISIITMISFSINLYLICMKLMKAISPIDNVLDTVHFWFTLLFLLGRTLAVSLLSAEINDESKRPLEVFRVVPKQSWCLEVRRFAEEVSSDIIALSGMRFFYLTRGLVLSVGGTIVTYELVLMQFRDNNTSVQCDFNDL